MQIECYPGDYIIKTSRTTIFFDQNYIDFTIKALKIKNNSNQQVRITGLQYEMSYKNQLIQKITYNELNIQQKINTFSRFAKDLSMLRKKTGFGEGLRVGNLQKAFGSESIWDENQLAFTTRLNPQKEVGIVAEHIQILTNHEIDQLKIQITFSIENNIDIAELRIPLVDYHVKNEFIFPVNGKWHVIGTFDDYRSGHRVMHSQEFAFDLDKLYETVPLTAGEENQNYPCYREKIFAVGAGEVVQTNTQIPENPTAGEDLDKFQLETLWKKVGYEPLGPGNFIVIKHPFNEYSFYAHLIPSSVMVSVGEMVKKGQILGLVGNSGNSDGPHLHFQLMNGPSTQTARGLPCTFTNLFDCYGNKIDYPTITSQIIFTK